MSEHDIIEECLSKLKVMRRSYTWKIKDFHNWPQTTSEPLVSPEFSIVTADHDVSCNIRLLHDSERVSRCTTVKDEIRLLINLQKNNKPYEDVNVHVKLFLYDNRGEICKKFEEWKRVEHKKYNCLCWEEFLHHSAVLREENHLLLQDTLTLRCEFTVPCGVENILRKTNNFRRPNELEGKILLDLKKLFESEELSDLIVISSCGREFHVHKNILSARSNVFAAMFENDMLESSENIVRVTDIDGQIMYDLLHWMYTGKIESISTSNATEIIRAANKYAVEDLKLLCESVICENITMDNAVDMFVIANLHNANYLKNVCLNFIDKHMEQIMKTSGFQTLVSNRDPNFLEIFQELQKCNMEQEQ